MFTHAPFPAGGVRGVLFTFGVALIAALTAGSAVASPLSPLARRTLAVERAQSLAFVAPAPFDSSWQPRLGLALPVTDPTSISAVRLPASS